MRVQDSTRLLLRLRPIGLALRATLTPARQPAGCRAALSQGHGPIALGVVRADDVPFAGLLEHDVPVDGRLAGLDIHVEDQEIRIVAGERDSPTRTVPMSGRAQIFVRGNFEILSA